MHRYIPNLSKKYVKYLSTSPKCIKQNFVLKMIINLGVTYKTLTKD